MTKKLSFLTACLAATALFTACKKNGDSGGTPEPAGGYTTLEALYHTQISPGRTVNINNDGPNTLESTSGVQYVIPDSAFTLADGTPVFGTVTLQLKEYVSKKDMIFHRMLPITDTSVLEGYGMVYIQATKNGDPLLVKTGKKIAAFLPQVPGFVLPADLTLFTGTLRPDSSISRIKWKAATTDDGGADPLPGYAVVYTSTLGYLMAGNYQPGDKRKITLNLSGFPSFDENAMLRTYVLYNNLKTTYALAQAPYGYRNGASVLDSFVANQPAHFIAFGIKDGFFYGGIKEATISSDSTLSLEMNKMEAVDLFSQVGALK